MKRLHSLLVRAVAGLAGRGRRDARLRSAVFVGSTATQCRGRSKRAWCAGRLQELAIQKWAAAP
jgi:hypothetical protein